MKIFRTLQRQYAILGVYPSAQKYPFNARVFFGFLLLGCVSVSQFVYIFLVADGFMEYMECVCSTFTTFIIIVCLAAVISRKTTLFESIDDIEQYIDTSK